MQTCTKKSQNMQEKYARKICKIKFQFLLYFIFDFNFAVLIIY